MWTCKNCKTLFQAKSGSRFCFVCFPRKCVSCNADLNRIDAIHCKTCKSEHVIKKAKQWYEINKSKKLEYDAKRRVEHREKYREASRRNRENRPAEKKAAVIKRRTGIKQTTPLWANHKYMNIFYKLAKEETLRTGRKVHVDHIIPLKGKYVTGLHCEFNLQLLFESDNLSKGNKLLE